MLTLNSIHKSKSVATFVNMIVRQIYVRSRIAFTCRSLIVNNYSDHFSKTNILSYGSCFHCRYVHKQGSVDYEYEHDEIQSIRTVKKVRDRNTPRDQMIKLRVESLREKEKSKKLAKRESIAKQNEDWEECTISISAQMLLSKHLSSDKRESGNDTEEPAKSVVSSGLSRKQFAESLHSINWDTTAMMHKATIDSQVIEEDETEVEGYDGYEISTIDPSGEFVEQINLESDTNVKVKNMRKSARKEDIADPTVPMSNFPCLGCGAKLHCVDPGLAGFMQSRKFKSKTVEAFRKAICQRCELIRYGNAFVNVTIHKDEFQKLFKTIRLEKCLVLILVDLLDMKNNIIQNLLNGIGLDKELYILGNKVDMLPKDDHGYLERIKKELYKTCVEGGYDNSGKNIRHVCLISGKTGFGVEELITKLFVDWKCGGNVYVVGHENSGKSTLFNALLLSDFCFSTARPDIKLATTSVWPGTTLSLLRFPINHMNPLTLHKRMKKYIKNRNAQQEERMLLRYKAKEGKLTWKLATLKGDVGPTDLRSEKTIKAAEKKEYDEFEGYDMPTFEYDAGTDKMLSEGGRHLIEKPRPGFDPDSFGNRFKWLHDTPGLINNEQIYQYLEQDELYLILPRRMITPRVFFLRPGQVMLISGVGRVEYTLGIDTLYITVYTSPVLPIHSFVDKEQADQFYNHYVGTRRLGIPIGDKERLDRLPPLKGQKFTIEGEGHWIGVADIQLSSLGWIGIGLTKGSRSKVTAYTPGGVGMYLRTPSLLPNYEQFKGRRIDNTNRYNTKDPML